MEYYIDLGSSTIKVYREEDEVLSLVEEKSIYFKNDFDLEKGISKENKEALLEYFTTLKKKYSLSCENNNIFVTGIFRNLNKDRKKELIKIFNKKFNLFFNIISHGVESYYLAKAMQNDYNNKKVMIVNMGGKTTELITFKNNEIVDSMNLNIGVAELLNKFPEVNDKYSSVTVEEILVFVREQIKGIKFDKDYDCAIFTGGEERWQKLSGYNIKPNTLFDDGINKYMIGYDDYIEGTNKAFHKITIEELYNLMPSNPKWMDGARPGAVLPLAIFEKAGINIIIPSDLNLINGVINDLK